MHPRQRRPLLPAPAHTTGHIWQPAQWAVHLSPQNLPCPSAAVHRAERRVSLPGELAAHAQCLFRHRFSKVSGRVSNPPACAVNGCIHSPTLRM